MHALRQKPGAKIHIFDIICKQNERKQTAGMAKIQTKLKIAKQIDTLLKIL